MTDAAPQRRPSDSASQISGNIGDVLASIRRLIAQDEAAKPDDAPAEDGHAALAAPEDQQAARADASPLAEASRKAERPLILRLDEPIRPLRSVPAPPSHPSAEAAGGPAALHPADAEPLRAKDAGPAVCFPEAQSRTSEASELCPGFPAATRPAAPKAVAEEGARLWAEAAEIDGRPHRREPAVTSDPAFSGAAAVRERSAFPARPAEAPAPAAALMPLASRPAASLEGGSWTRVPDYADAAPPCAPDCRTRSKAQPIMTLAPTQDKSSAPPSFAISAREPAGGPLLRSLLRDLLRQELRGELGGDLGHYMRLMVREEIALALTEAMERPV